MSEQSNLARPYAKAVFELARDAGDYTKWTDQLAFLATVSGDSGLIEAFNNPALSKSQKADLLLNISADQLDEQGLSLAKLLVENDRVDVLTEISEQFVILRDEAEQIIEAQLITASEIDDARRDMLQNALSKRLGKKIKLQASVDESLIGGAIVRAGDWVVDGSVKAQLQDLDGAIGA